MTAIKRVFFFLAMLLLAFSMCSDKTPANQKKNTGVKTVPKDASSNALVTFVELGSINCIPCRMMQPVMKEIDSIYAGKVKVVFIDVLTDQGKPYAQQFGIRAIPTQVFLDAQGKELARHIGFYPKDSIVALLASKGLK